MIRRLVLDVLKPHKPSVVEVSEALSHLEGVEGVNIIINEIDQQVENAKVIIASLWAAIIGGGAPALTGAICLLPFFLSTNGLFPITSALQISVGLALAIMFMLGAILGKISCRNMILHGLKMLLVGVILTVIFLTLKIT